MRRGLLFGNVMRPTVPHSATSCQARLEANALRGLRYALMGQPKEHLPHDFGARVRAAASYWGNGGLQAFAQAINRPGMRYNTMRKWIEQNHRPPLLAQKEIVARLAEVSELPESFFTGDGDSAHRLEERLEHIQHSLEEALAFFKTMQQLQTQQGRQAAPRELQDRLAMDRPPPPDRDADECTTPRHRPRA